MALISAFWNSNQRLQTAAENHPPIRLFDADKTAVTLLQQAMVDTGIAPALQVDGIFGAKTAAAVRSVETQFNMDPDEGVAGRQTLGILDILLQNGQLGRDLAQTDTPLAGQKIAAAVLALNGLKTALKNGTTPATLTADGLSTHFRLTLAPSAPGITRQVTDADIDAILLRYNQLLGLFAASGIRFRTGVPVNGIDTAAEAPLNGPITFGPAFTNVDSHFGDRIGPHSRAAILMHEGVHVFDGLSGNSNTHISEFAPAYATQPADLSLHNPSSFAGFAAHIYNNGDPAPRFGLGPGARGL
ncbi:MAG: peptidoglycan-binding domain-containing protein [Methylococcaceae bacterium]|nr:peptidoglycan-binding domain-containing protein [Methylococcaceae bacterium]